MSACYGYSERLIAAEITRLLNDRFPNSLDNNENRNNVTNKDAQDSDVSGLSMADAWPLGTLSSSQALPSKSGSKKSSVRSERTFRKSIQ